ncbi:4-hydroxy-tetrahydrodipicolinate reductase [Salisediminibacterium beveridgei]|uniref:4-hydroxy-tetrahydrodipicolinate reductase n=1 Tax=Salisediminibacterium beveridgei TaxID=632773 RepID=A0A1D7QV43_9BACI|nr:4-hydroxy-tetrahydrodipicolinate reductase [Salisediminibacterium beveridgei]AOM82828.1 Dihydrodipicolinate reductase [Salisediminibacterium beveridgei]
MIKIVVAGARGKMGSEAVQMVLNEPDFELVGAVDLHDNRKMMSDIDGMPDVKVMLFEDMGECLQETKPDVLVDLTAPEVGKRHMKIALEHGVRPVVGTTGFTAEDVKELTMLAENEATGAIIAPNFAIGAVLLMKFSQTAAKYLSDVEIIEQHHDRKLDAPSGTAVKTAQMISEVRESRKQGHPDEEETMPGARGAEVDGMHIHSVRLPGLIAHQEVIFGGEGQSLTMRHDSYHRSSFMPGIKLAVNHVMGINTLIYGLDQIIQ